MTDQSIAPKDEKPQDADVKAAEPEPTPELKVEQEPEPAPEPAAEGLPPVPPLPESPPQADAVLPVEPRKPRRVLRATLRWTAAVLVFGALGGGVAYGVTQPERTEIPGLETPGDGRWEYPRLALPRLPAGKPAALDTTLNRGGRHYADMRSLLLPAPEGAKPDPAFPGEKGWLPTDRYLKLFGARGAEPQGRYLVQEGLRHIAARAWTMPDGTRAEIYLLQFSTGTYVERYRDELSRTPLDGAPTVDTDRDLDSNGAMAGASLYQYVESGSSGAAQLRYGLISAGDTLGLVVLSHAGAMPAVPFRQTITLQAQLLG
ncbi:hypothetical protein [Streptomyces sp. H39-S7]|uniref:hypothetical protein n=1 Tax=Streptomyces sp. H39-S7 TaxID=3004357 RepID=UPI0022B0546A|nr:hypothetical protein [Streptomyces sp. H39-S7]MCZ4120864.1 hypothetical protein [Streptomyces sp. H39-S7]